MIRALTAALLLTATSACGTALSMSEDQLVYGGVRWDATLIHGAFNVPETGPDDPPPGMGHSIAVGLAPLAILDVPLSLVADTVMLPITVPLWIARDGPEEPAETPTDGG